MLELDVMLQEFVTSSYAGLSTDKQQLFEDLLEEADQDLQRWLVGSQVCDKPRLQDLILVIRHMHQKAQQMAAQAAAHGAPA